jgi:hypothetical protein
MPVTVIYPLVFFACVLVQGKERFGFNCRGVATETRITSVLPIVFEIGIR